MNKPSIRIYVIEPDREILKEICAGIEEEGIFYEVIRKENKDIHELCFESANDSILGTGIGIYNSVSALTISALPKGKQIFNLDKPTLQQARFLGINAARAVKKLSFKEI